jgi:hypothetical protein
MQTHSTQNSALRWRLRRTDIQQICATSDQPSCAHARCHCHCNSNFQCKAKRRCGIVDEGGGGGACVVRRRGQPVFFTAWLPAAKARSAVLPGLEPGRGLAANSIFLIPNARARNPNIFLFYFCASCRGRSTYLRVFFVDEPHSSRNTAHLRRRGGGYGRGQLERLVHGRQCITSQLHPMPSWRTARALDMSRGTKIKPRTAGGRNQVSS